LPHGHEYSIPVRDSERMNLGQRGSELPVIEGLRQALLGGKDDQDGEPSHQPLMKPFGAQNSTLMAGLPSMGFSWPFEVSFLAGTS
jgi:hypothetical protein